MAYPTVDGPYGLKPVALKGGQAYAGATRMYTISTSEGTAIFTGDVVVLTGTNGNITKQTATNTGTVIAGVFMGCSYTNATTGQKIFSQYAPATPPSDIVAYVADDPDTIFKVAVCSSGTTMSGVTRDVIGANAAFLANAGSTTTGNSKFAINATTATTTSLPLKILDVVPETVNASGSATEVLVVFNPYCHFLSGFTAV